MKRSHLAREIVETIALALLIFLAIHFTIQNYMVDGPSMQKTLYTNQYVLVNKVAYLFHAPERGDIIVFGEPDVPNRDLIKRVIGVPGDTVHWDGTNVWVDGVELNEPYITSKSNYNAGTVKLGPNQYFVMGDNRPKSEDSRVFGIVPKDNIIGKAIVVDWPLNQWKILDTYPSVFSHIK